MPAGLAVALVVAACIAIVVLPKILGNALGSAVEHGVDKAVEAHKRGRPSQFWLVPSATSALSLCETVRAHVAGSDDIAVLAQVVERKGREVVECSIAAGADAEFLRADLLRAARKRDAWCVLELP